MVTQSKQIKMAVLIGNGGRLKAICECVKNIANVEIVAVVSYKTESAGIEWAKLQGLNAFYFRLSDFENLIENHKEILSEIFPGLSEITNSLSAMNPQLPKEALPIDFRKKFNLALAAKLKQLSVNFIVMAGWNIVMDDLFLKQFPNQVINIHPSLLPAFPGPWNKVSRQILDSGVKFTGCTLHFVPDSGVDGGPIILQAVIPVGPIRNHDKNLFCPKNIFGKIKEFFGNAFGLISNGVEHRETHESLRKKLDIEEEKILADGIRLFAEGRLRVEGKKVIIEN